MSKDKVHIPDQQWRKNKRKQRLKNKKRDRERIRIKNTKNLTNKTDRFLYDLDEE